MRAGLIVLIVLVGLYTELRRARADEDVASSIPIHPRVVTVLQLPDEIVHTWLDHHGDIRVARIRDKLYIRPRPGTPAGVKASLEVETRTLRRTFQLIVVARARDARQDVVIEAVDVQAAAEAPPEAPETAHTDAVASAAEEPTTNAPSPAPPRAEPEPTAPEPARAADERPVETVMLPRFVLSAHAVAGVGFTGLEMAGYKPGTALQSHHTLGLRLVGASRAHGLSLVADVSAEWPAGPMLFKQGLSSTLAVTGARLRGEVGLRASAGTRWIPSVHAGLGLQVHLRRTVETSFSEGPETVTTLARGAVLVLGLGLQHRVRSTLLGLDFHVRQGGPDDYFSVTALLTLGRLLDQGE